MSTKDIKELQAAVKSLKRAFDKLGKEGISRQESQANQLSEIKTAIIEAHEKEKKELKDRVSLHKNEIILMGKHVAELEYEIVELKKKVKA